MKICDNLRIVSFFSGLSSNNSCFPLWDCVCPAFHLTTGGMCPPGYFCPQGSGKPLPCDGGSYCEHPGLALPTGQSADLLTAFYRVFILYSLFFYLFFHYFFIYVFILYFLHF